jgi:hypothetical protein
VAAAAGFAGSVGLAAGAAVGALALGEGDEQAASSTTSAVVKAAPALSRLLLVGEIMLCICILLSPGESIMT